MADLKLIGVMILIISMVIKYLFKFENIHYYTVQAFFMAAILIYEYVYMKYVDRLKNQYDRELFNYVSMNDTEGLKLYVDKKYKNIKALENVYFYVIKFIK